MEVLYYQASAGLAIFCCLPDEGFPIEQLIATSVIFTADENTGAHRLSPTVKVSLLFLVLGQ